MEYLRKNKIFFNATIGIFVFLRLVVYLPANLWGVDIDEIDVVFSFRKLAFLLLIVVFSTMVALILSKMQKTNKKSSMYFCVWFLLDPVFILSQNNYLKIIVAILGMLCVLNALQKKPLVKVEIAIFVYLFISTVLLPSAIFSYVPLVIVFYLLYNISAFKLDNAKKFRVGLMLFVAFAGVLTNSALTKEFGELPANISMVDDFIVQNSYKTVVLFLPNIVIAVLYFKRLLGAFVDSTDRKIKYILKSNIGKSMVLLIAAYLVGIIGAINGDSSAVCTINLLVSGTILILSSRRGDLDEITLKIDNIVDKHFLAIITSVILWGWLSFNIFVDYVEPNGKTIYETLKEFFIYI